MFLCVCTMNIFFLLINYFNCSSIAIMVIVFQKYGFVMETTIVMTILMKSIYVKTECVLQTISGVNLVGVFHGHGDVTVKLIVWVVKTNHHHAVINRLKLVNLHISNVKTISEYKLYKLKLCGVFY